MFLDSISLFRKLKEIRPDIIYQRIGCAYTGICAYYAKVSGCKMIWHVSSDSNTNPSKLTFNRRIIINFIDRKFFEYGVHHAHHIFAQTITQEGALKTNYNKHNVTVVRNFHPLPKEPIVKDDRVRIVWIANLKQLKQPEIFIRLANDFKEQANVDFIMIGATQDKSSWTAQILEQIEQAKNIQYLGFREQDEVNAILARSHILVNTSLWEGFTNTFIQAWMRKVPCISLSVNPDNIFDNELLGLYAGNYEKLKDHTLALIHDKERMRKMGENSQSYAFEHHSYKNAENIQQIFRNLLKSN